MSGRPSPPLSDADYQALARFRHALRIFLHFSEEAARDAGLTPAQHQLLLAVRGHPGTEAPAVGDLAEVLQTRTHSVVGLVDRAEEAGLVTSERDAADSRRRLVSLTARGDAVLAHLSDLHRRELRGFRVEMAKVLDELG